VKSGGDKKKEDGKKEACHQEKGNQEEGCYQKKGNKEKDSQKEDNY
jgi:hypothetical protein